MSPTAIRYSKLSILPLLLTACFLLCAPLPVARAAPLVQQDTACDALNQEGIALYGQAQYRDALEQFQNALTCYREADDRTGEGSALNNIGFLYSRLGQYQEALEYYGQALAIRQEVGDRAGEGVSLNNIGAVYASLGQYQEALEYYQQALAIRQEIGDRDGEGTTLNNIGFVYDSLGQYQEALDTYQQVLTILRELGDQAGESVSLNNIGAVYASLGQYQEALDYYQQALTIVREIGDRVREGGSLNNIGTVYASLGQYQEALDYYQQALAMVQEIGDRVGESASLNNIGAVYESLGQYQEALDTYQQALAIQQEIGDRAGEGTTLNNIGAVYRHLGQNQEALTYYQQALAIRQKIGDRAGESASLNSIGLVLRHRGQYQRALEYYEQALAIRQEIGDRAGEGGSLNNIGAIYEILGQYQQAFDTYQQALAIRQEIGNRVGEGTTLNNIGGIYDSLGQYEEALDYYALALAIQREIGDRAGEGATLNNIGLLYNNLGQYQEALDTYQQALAILQEIGDRAGEGTTLNNIGTIYDSLGQYQEALDTYQHALAIRQEIGDRAGEGQSLNNIGGIYDSLGQYQEALDHHQQALAILQEIGDRVGEGIALINIGFIYERQSQPEQALLHYEQAMTVFEAMRATVGSEAGRASFIAQYTDLYHRVVNLYHVQGQDDQAFLTAEQGRARAFLDAMTTGYVQLSDANAADLLAREQAAHAACQTARDALSRARAQQPPDAALIADLEAQLTAAEEERAAARAAIEARHDQLAALVPGRSAVLDLSRVQALLDEQTTLVSFWVLEDQTLAFVVTRDGLHTVTLPVSQADLVTHIIDFHSFPNLDIAHPESAVTLYAELIAPLKEYLPSTSSGGASGKETAPHLVIVPHSVLHYLPFAALTDGQRYLVDDYTLTYLPSASVLPFIQANASTSLSTGSGGEEGAPLILGNPATGDFDTTASFATERNGLGPLPFAEQEARAIAALYDAPAYIGPKATESQVWQEAGESSFLHLAAHGYYNPVAPLHSLIALAPDEVNDGWLTVGEVYGLDLQGADLVVLSACQSQLGDLSAGDELVGLTRAFFYSGTPTVVASLWTVDDRATALLMERFYTHLRAGMGKAAALRQAQLDIRAEYPNPYYWAGFVLSGDEGEGAKMASTEEIEPTKETGPTREVEPTRDVQDEKESEGTPGSGLIWVMVVAFLVVVVGSGVWAWRRRG